MRRRRFLRLAGGSAAALALGRQRASAGEAQGSGWRAFEVRTRLDIAGAAGVTRAWMPLPLLHDTDYQRRRGDTWKGNARQVRIHRGGAYGAGVLAIEWPAGEVSPTLEITSRVETRDRVIDLSRPSPRAPKESASTLELYLRPTKLIPTDGIVRETANRVANGRGNEIEKARALYEWVVENTFRDPKVEGCGTGNIKAMLESGSLGGKCADLNALFVGLARAAGIPARDVYGVRAGESKEFKCLGRSGDVSKAQHCRAEFYAAGYGWIPVDPADVRKVVLEEPPGNRALDDPVVENARRKLFGEWEMNWLAYNYAHDLALPGAVMAPLPFFMYPQCETAGGRKNSLDPAAFQYRISFVHV